MSEGVDWAVGGDLGVVSMLPKAPFPRSLDEREDFKVKVGRIMLSRMSCAIFCPGLTWKQFALLLIRSTLSSPQ
eukprot:6767700-Ditylum_brightwellii.AAC.1